MDFEALKARPWLKESYFKGYSALKYLPTMLSIYEQKMLHWLGNNLVGKDAVLDMGTFLGGSTAFLAQGIRDRKDGKKIRLNSYDLYRLGPYERQVWFLDKGLPLPKDDNFRPLYEKNIKQYKDMVTIHEGDVCQEQWTGAPIEFLFIDLAKISAVGDHLLQVFFPSLRENSILVQQDYLWPGTPWIPVSMVKLEACFERLVSEPCSVLYRCKRTPTKEELDAACWKNLTPQDRVHSLKQAIAMETDPEMIRRLTVSFTDGSLNW